LAYSCWPSPKFKKEFPWHITLELLLGAFERVMSLLIRYIFYCGLFGSKVIT